LFDLEEIPEEKEDNFTTLTGFILSYINKVPETGETFQWDKLCFEIVDMDGHYIDKVLLRYIDEDKMKKYTYKNIKN